MRRFLFLSCVAAALACGSVNDKQGCSVSTDCPVGQFCAAGGGENHCWPDSVRPTVTGVTASCTPSPCLRDGAVHVEATVSDDNEVFDAVASLDLSSARSFPLSRSGAVWSAEVPLSALPFDFFAHDVVATVVARDGARNVSAPLAGNGVAVTRLRWERAIDAGAVVTPTAPALMSDGTVVVGGSNGKVYFVALNNTDAHQSLSVATGAISAAPAIGRDAIWTGSEDFKLYALKLDGSGVLANFDTLGAATGSVAVLTEPTKEWGFATSASKRVCALSSGSDTPARSPAGTDPFTTGPVISLDGRIYAATTATASSTLSAFTFDGAFTAKWPTPPGIGVNVSAPIAVDAAGNLWTGSQDAKLSKTVPADTSGTVTPVATLPGSIVDSPVILANGDVVVGDQSGLLHRFNSAGVSQWATEPNLGGAVLAPMVLSAGTTTLIVPTKSGTIHAVRGDGTQMWSASLAATELRAGNIFTPPGQTGAILSTAYFTGANGRLYAVIVDGQLDASAPWPKAFHDPKNTNHAGPQP